MKWIQLLIERLKSSKVWRDWLKTDQKNLDMSDIRPSKDDIHLR